MKLRYDLVRWRYVAGRHSGVSEIQIVSGSFSVRAGIHEVRATIVDTIPPYPPFIYSWPDTTVDVAVGAEVVRKLPFYCSMMAAWGREARRSRPTVRRLLGRLVK